MNFEDLIARCDALPYTMPTQANRLAALKGRSDEVEAHAAAVRPILHARVRRLIEEFLALERECGSEVERAVYADMDACDFVTRLLCKRPLCFLTASDSFRLRDGTNGAGGFDAIGTAGERPPLQLKDLLSYDEMAISALLGVSVPTHFINSGSRRNQAEPGAVGSFEERGIYTGLVGPRFERPGRMEWQHMIVTARQNTAANGYGEDAVDSQVRTRSLEIWARLYGIDRLPSVEEAAADRSGRYLMTRDGRLDTLVYQARLRLSIEAFLLDADDRARTANQAAYVHAVGLGLGVWGIDKRQAQLMVDVYADVVRECTLEHIADIDFSWLGEADQCGGVVDGGTLCENGNSIGIHFSQREPAARLTGADAGKLLVAMYAWDSNAWPGNEYWGGSLSASGDPAAACCSTIPELQNPDVNPRVSGEFAVVLGDGLDRLRADG